MFYQALTNTAPTPQAIASTRGVRWLRWLRLAVEFARAGWTLWWHFPRLEREGKLDEIKSWAKRVLLILEVEVACHGSPPSGFAGLVVANHVSWLDILVIQSLLPGVFVAKAEVRRWPLVGSLAQACATIFVQRTSARSARAMVDASVAAFGQGYCVVGFPEGTSGDGSDLGVFHSNIFECAIRAKTQVQPLVLRYVNAQTGQPSEAPVFIGDTTLTSSLKRVMATPSIQAQLHFGAWIPAQGHSRKTLAAQTHQSMRGQLLGHRAGRVPGV
jgi:1-acyl-sn-glycerol-3-phosphate acyltransferase